MGTHISGYLHDMGTHISGYLLDMGTHFKLYTIYSADFFNAISVPLELQRKKAGTYSQIHRSKVNYSELNSETPRGKAATSSTLLHQVRISLTVETLRWQQKLLDLSACSCVNDWGYDCECIQYSCQF